jgi:predicted site-specific integrase-resolvase
MSTDPLLTRKQTAQILGVKPQTLSKWAMTGEKLPVVQISGRCVRYRPDDVAAFIESRTRGAAE